MGALNAEVAATSPAAAHQERQQRHHLRPEVNSNGPGARPRWAAADRFRGATTGRGEHRTDRRSDGPRAASAPGR